MQDKLGNAVLEALSAGYQIDPEAYDLLQSLSDKADISKIVVDAVKNKQKSSDVARSMLLTKLDIEGVISGLVEELMNVRKGMMDLVSMESKVDVVKDSNYLPEPLDSLEGFQSLFRSRFEKLMRIVRERPDSGRIQSLAALRSKMEKSAKVAGLVLEKKVRRGQVELVIDDESDRLKVQVTEPELARIASEIQLDQVVVLDLGFSKSGGVIVKSVYSPDIPDHIGGRAQKRVYCVLTSDLHVGSRKFLFTAFQKFLLWLNGQLGDRDIVERVKYIVIGGDAVDGVGVYPRQEEDLEDLDVRHQYAKVAQLLEQVPKKIEIFMIPGNHDPVRQALPQPAISRHYAEHLYKLENVKMLGNPSVLSLHNVKLLMYHGRSLDDVVATTPGLSFSKPAGAMKILLRARHVAPIYGGRTEISPMVEDSLVMEDVPDIFHCGHVHTVDAEYYRGTLIVNSGAWQAQTAYQANMGIRPVPGVVPVVNLSTLDIFFMDFVEGRVVKAS